MAAKNEMTITVRAVDAATRVLHGIKASVSGVSAGVLKAGVAFSGVTKLLSKFTSESKLYAESQEAVSKSFGSMTDKAIQWLREVSGSEDRFFKPMKAAAANAAAVKEELERAASPAGQLEEKVKKLNEQLIKSKAHNFAGLFGQTQDPPLLRGIRDSLTAIGAASDVLDASLAKSFDSAQIEAFAGNLKLLQDYYELTDEQIEAATESMREYVGVHGKANAVISAQTAQWNSWTSAVERAKERAEQLAEKIGEISDVMTDRTLEAIDAFIDGTKKMGQAFKDMIGSILRDLLRLELRVQLSKVFSSLLSGLAGGFSGGGGGGTGTSSSVSAFGSGAGAGGLPVSAPSFQSFGPTPAPVINVTIVGNTNPGKVQKEVEAALARALATNRSIRQKVRTA